MKQLLLSFFLILTVYSSFSIAQTVMQPINEEEIKEPDNDKDGIPNRLDKCPNTIDGVCVDGNGCIAKIRRVVHFASDSYIVDERSKPLVKSILEIAQECFGYKIVLKGYTDSTGSDDLNKELSRKRVLSIQTTLLNYGIDPKRITIKWYGEEDPLDSNKTKKGRYKNRRVEILFY